MQGGERGTKSKRAAPKKATPKKATPKRATLKRATPKRATPKKATPKKATPKKAVPNKAPKKGAPKKAARKKSTPKSPRLNEPRGEYESGLEVTASAIAQLDESALGLLMHDLVFAEAYRSGTPVDQIWINTEERAGDGGGDATTPAPTRSSNWFGSTETCWQFKAGSAGTPARIANEVANTMPAATLRRGGRYVVVCNASNSGTAGHANRLAALKKVAREEGIPSSRIDVITSETLTTWCNSIPAVASRWSGLPSSIWRLDQWSQSPEHQHEWKPLPGQRERTDELARMIDPISGSVQHLHVVGAPGVGKTRFVLELCKAASWASLVVYARQAEDAPLVEILDGAAAHPSAMLLVVADETPSSDLRILRSSLDLSSGRVRLITIGHDPSPDIARIPTEQIRKMDVPTMTLVVRQWYPGMPLETAAFVARFCDGYVRLARLAADAIARDSTLDVGGLLGQNDIVGFMKHLLGEKDRKALYVVAVLDHLGWDDEFADEGKVVAECLGQTWINVRADVEAIHRQLGVAPRGGRFRYISPEPLGAYLALEAWVIYKEQLVALPDKLPSDRARNAFYARLNLISSNPSTSTFAREQLRQTFFQVADLQHVASVRKWSALAAADPHYASLMVRTLLESSSSEERRLIKDEARRRLVDGLVRLAWMSDAFIDATLSVGLLAEEETATWSNNATGEFTARFSLWLGGTEVAYVDRLPVLDRMLEIDRPALTSLVVLALAAVGDSHSHRTSLPPIIPGANPVEWEPRRVSEVEECVDAALQRVVKIAAATGALSVAEKCVELVERCRDLLLNETAREQLMTVIRTLSARFPALRTKLHKVIAEFLDAERNLIKRATATELEPIQALKDDLRDRTLNGRLREAVELWPSDVAAPIPTTLVADLLANASTVADALLWLTSGEATRTWDLGAALGAADQQNVLLAPVTAFAIRGNDLRFVGGYLVGRQRVLGVAWLEDLLDEKSDDTPDVGLVVEVTWRALSTGRAAQRIVRLARRGLLQGHHAGQLAFGPWSSEIPESSFRDVVSVFMDEPAFHAAAIAMLDHRLEVHKEEWGDLAEFAARAVSTIALIRSSGMTAFHWGRVATRVAKERASDVAGAILDAAAVRDLQSWFVGHHEAARILDICVATDPTGVWERLRPHLEDYDQASRFRVGFPRGLVDRLPRQSILDWIEESPTVRAPTIARLANGGLRTGDIWCELLRRYGSAADIGNVIFSTYVSGMWSGSASEHWLSLAGNLEQETLAPFDPAVRRWAKASIEKLKRLAEQDRSREAEEELGL